MLVLVFCCKTVCYGVPYRTQSMAHGKEPLTSVEVVPGRQKSHIEGDVAHGGVELEDGDDGDLHEDQKDWVLPGTEDSSVTIQQPF